MYAPQRCKSKDLLQSASFVLSCRCGLLALGVFWLSVTSIKLSASSSCPKAERPEKALPFSWLGLSAEAGKELKEVMLPKEQAEEEEYMEAAELGRVISSSSSLQREWRFHRSASYSAEILGRGV